MGPKSDHCLALSVSHSLIHSLTIKCCWDLTDVTQACEDARVATDHFMGRSSLLWQNLAAMMPGQYQSHLSGMVLCICSNRQTIVFSAICRDTLSISVWSEIIWKDVLSICLSKRALINLTARKSCLMHLSKLLHGFVNVVTGICQSPGFVVPLAMFMIIFREKKFPFFSSLQMPYPWSWQPALKAHHFAARAKLYTQDYLLLQKKIASAHYNKQ